jgi:hypothetical protein
LKSPVVSLRFSTYQFPGALFHERNGALNPPSAFAVNVHSATDPSA